MKFKLTRLTSSIALAITAALLMATSATRAAEGAGASPEMDAVFRARYGISPASPMIDPATGLPVQQVPAWKDPNWKDPEKVLADVSYDGLPLTEVAKNLRHEFKDAFDVLIPNSWHHPNLASASVNAAETPITMQLKNVSASEVFNAMNVVFEIENTPLRWELQMIGKRPVAVIRVLPELVAPGILVAEPPKRMIYFVGDLVGDEKAGGMSVERLLKTVEEIYQLSYGSSGGVLRFHKEAQLLIVTGTVDQIDFVQQTLGALREKVDLERKPRSKPAESKTKTDQPKSP